MSEKRTKIPQEVVDKIMVQCKRKCCWCEIEKATEIHHIDHDASNNDEDNLFSCCSLCQKEFHTSAPFTRKITENELKMRRDNFYAKSNFEVDVLSELKEIKPSIETIRSELVKKIEGETK